jgi:hypothetical protein
MAEAEKKEFYLYNLYLKDILISSLLEQVSYAAVNGDRSLGLPFDEGYI